MILDDAAAGIRRPVGRQLAGVPAQATRRRAQLGGMAAQLLRGAVQALGPGPEWVNSEISRPLTGGAGIVGTRICGIVGIGICGGSAGGAARRHQHRHRSTTRH